jgi:hypothetical protein
MIVKSDDRRILAFQRGKEISERLPIAVSVGAGVVVVFLLVLIATSI